MATESSSHPAESSPEKAAQKAIRAATLLWMASVLLSRVMGFLREIVIARQVGANAETDVYFAAFTLPDFVNYLLAGGALSITFIPIFSKYLAEGNEEEGWKVFSQVTSFLAVVLTVILGVAFVFAPELTPLLAKGFSPEQQEKLVYLTRILLPAQLFLFEGFLLSAVQMAKGEHRLPALSPLLYNGFTILGGLILGGSLGMEGFAWGVLAGAILGSFGLQVMGARRVGMRWRFTLDVSHPGFRQYFKLSLPIMLGQSLVVWDEWLTRYYGSFLTAATISWLNYGRKLAMVPQAVFGQAAGAASYPYLARKAAEGQVLEVWSALLGALRSTLVMAVGTQVLLTVVAYELCEVLFRSQQFGPTDVAATASTLIFFSLGIAGWSAQGLLARGFYAFQDTLTPTLLGTMMTVLSAPLYSVLGQHLAHSGLALGSSLAITVYATMLWMLLRRKVGQAALEHGQSGVALAGLGGFLIRLFLAAGLASLGGWGVQQLMLQGVTGEQGALAQLLQGLANSGSGGALLARSGLALIQGAVTGLVAGVLFIGVCLMLRLEEIRGILEKILRRVRRRRS